MPLPRTSHTPPVSFAGSRARRIGAVALLIAIGTVTPLPAATGLELTFRPVVMPAQPWQEDLAVLQDSNLTPEARTAACRRMLSSPEPAAVEALVGLLGPQKRTGDTQQLILREIGLQAQAPSALLAPLETWLRESTPDKHPPLYRAISSIRTRPAAQLLLSYAGPSATSENREAIYQSLTRLTGRNDLGTDRDAWSKWLAAAEQWSEEQWKSQLAANLALRADLLRVQRDDAIRRLVESERARFVAATDTKARSAHLAAMLRDDLPNIRRLGIELINRELANARELDPDVGAATLELLKDPSAEVRSAGADLVDRLVPIGAPLVVRDALARERDPNVLAKLLRLARRFPDIAPPEMLMGWLGAETVVRRAAIDAVAAMQAAGVLASPIDLDRALVTLRSEKPDELSADGLKLLCELGNEDDRQAVAAMLLLPSAESRLRAAQALAPFPERLDEILAAAKADPTLFSVAASAVARHRATLDGYRALQSLPAPNPIALREAVNALCQRLPLADLRDAALATTDNDVRETMLARVVDLTARSAAAPDHDPFTGADGAALVETLFLLARTQLELNKPGAALGTLDLLPPSDEKTVARARPMRLKALLYLDRFEEAMALDGSADEWLDAMEYAVALPHALAIGAEIDLRFGSDLTAEQHARLDRLNQEAKRPRAARNDSGGLR